VTAEERIQTLGLELPQPPKPRASYVPAKQVGSLLFVSGHGPLKSDGTMITGRLGDDMQDEQGKLAARQVGLTMLATLKELGYLNKIKSVVKVLGMVNCTPEFGNQPEVINGFSDLMGEVFGDDGRHARSAVGMLLPSGKSAPGSIAVEVEAIFEV